MSESGRRPNRLIQFDFPPRMLDFHLTEDPVRMSLITVREIMGYALAYGVWLKLWTKLVSEQPWR